MSMHKNPLTYMEKRGLHAHGLPTDEPSQLSDAFRAGVAWAGHEVQSLKNELEAKVRQNAQLMRERDAYCAAEAHQIALRQKMEAEMDALAVHIERLKSALDNILSEVGTHSHDDLSDDERQALSALDAAPTTSLARRDAMMRVVGARIVAEKAWKRHNFLNLGSSERERAANHATLVANELRQQAEAANEPPA